MSASSAERALPGRPAVRWLAGRWLRPSLTALLAVAATGRAEAAVFGGVTASSGWVAALSAVMGDSWPEQLPGAAWPVASLALVGGLLWRRRSGWSGRWSGRVIGPVGLATGGKAPLAAGTARVPPEGVEQIALPVGLERRALLAELESHFVALQQAWDAGDLHALKELTTADMLAEICECRAGCLQAALVPPSGGPAEVEALRAELLAFEETAETCLVSVDFSGSIRESAASAALPFREVWMLVAARQPPRAWRLARHHALL